MAWSDKGALEEDAEGGGGVDDFKPVKPLNIGKAGVDDLDIARERS